MRTLMHASYSFRKKISHAADSQDQRHRMTPGSRPLLQTHFSGEPDYIVPLIVKQDDLVLKRYEEIQNQIWEKVNQAIKLGMSYEQFSYMLPNALSVRFSESGDLLALKHKMNMRLCYNAQEEIWQASLEEALQISEVHPEIGIHLLPPCSVRYLGGQRPICPEGERFCGVPVWKLTREQYQRSI
jgi:thymidylate synthase ThyX